MVRILCFGDSNTYGYISGGRGRFPKEVRYTGVLQELLGSSYIILEDGLNGRTTAFEDPIPGRRGIDAIEQSVRENDPDMLFIMLGTNDCKLQFGNDSCHIVQGMEEIAQKALEVKKNLKIVFVSPISIDPVVLRLKDSYNEKSLRVNHELADAYRKSAGEKGYGFMNAALYAEPDKTDGEHMNEKGHRALAEGMAATIKSYEK